MNQKILWIIIIGITFFLIIGAAIYLGYILGQQSVTQEYLNNLTQEGVRIKYIP